MTQDVDPSGRPGAGPGGYAVLKMHPFFKGIDWKNIRGQTPPKLASEPMVNFLLLIKLLSVVKSNLLPCLALVKSSGIIF